MRKGRKILICVIGVGLALLAFVAYKQSRREPSYNGHPLSYWVAVVGTPGTPGPDLERATNAVSHIGVAALPFLVKWIQFAPPKWKRTLASRLARTTFAPTKTLGYRIIDPTLANGAELSFPILGRRAMPAFDALCRLMNATNSQKAIPAARALACLGTNALPPLLAAVTNAYHPAHRVALEVINRIPDLEQAAQLVAPVVASCLNPTNNIDVQVTAITILGRLNAAPEISVPALASSLKNPDPTVRIFSVNNLATFGPQASAAIPALTNALVDPHPFVRRTASNALHSIDPLTFPSPYGQ